MPVTATEVIVNLRAAPKMFPDLSLPPNYVRFRLGPDMGIALGASVMEGGREINGHGVELLVSETPTIDDLGAYERVLGDALAGDPGVFAREDYVEEAWRIVDPVLHLPSPPTAYVPGTWGPHEQDDLTPPWGWVNPAGARQSVQG
jgi:glucose-6-phosphate 1-dehydrogenase